MSTPEDRQVILRGELARAVKQALIRDPDITLGDVDVALRWMLEPMPNSAWGQNRAGLFLVPSPDGAA